MIKLLKDACVIARIKAYQVQRSLTANLLSVVIMPVAMLFFASNLEPEGGNLGPRLIAGSMVFSLGISTVNEVAQNMVFERFNHQLQLLVVAPVHRLSYAAGTLGFGALRGAIGALSVVLAAPLFGYSLELSFWLLPLALLTALSMAGISLVIGTWSPDQPTGNLLAQVAGILVVMVSPIYFELSRLPGWLQLPAQLSPYTHAAQAFQGSFSGSTELAEIGVLIAITIATMTLGVMGMRWRDI